MKPKPPAFTRHGTEERRTEVSADEILNAIAGGRDVEYVVIEEDVGIEESASQSK